VTGALDLAAIAALLEDLYGLIDAGHVRLILDLGGLRLCDATGTSTSTHHRCGDGRRRRRADHAVRQAKRSDWTG